MCDDDESEEERAAERLHDAIHGRDPRELHGCDDLRGVGYSIEARALDLAESMRLERVIPCPGHKGHLWRDLGQLRHGSRTYCRRCLAMALKVDIFVFFSTDRGRTWVDDQGKPVSMRR